MPVLSGVSEHPYRLRSVLRHNRLDRYFALRARTAQLPPWYVAITGRAQPEAWGEALLVIATCLVTAEALRGVLPPSSIPSVFLLGVLAVAVRRGLGAAMFTAVMSYVSIRFFFGAPFFDFGVSDRETYIAFTIFLLVAVVVGTIAARLRAQLEVAKEHTRRSALLYDLSRRLTAVADVAELTRTVTECVEEATNRAALVLLRAEGDALVDAPSDGAREGTLGAADRAAAAAALATQAATGAGTGRDDATDWRFMPITAAPPGGVPRVLGLLAVSYRQPRAAVQREDERRLLQSICDQAAVAFERVQLSAQRERARLLEESERLRTALLASVSHDLRTPLASIIGASSSLQELGPALSDGARNDLLDTVLGEAERLDRFVQNLLDMTRIEHGAIEPKRQWCDLRDTVGDALRHLRRTLGSHRVVVEISAGVPLLYTDPVLLDHVLVNLIDNARKFSPSGAPITLRAAATRNGVVTITIEDQGPGIPPAERERIFDMFSRLEGSDSKVTGTGLGLAICRGFVGALGGELVAQGGADDRGTRMVVTLPPSPTLDLPRGEESAA
jgi:two-component system sensor histidine kinase KdpD